MDIVYVHDTTEAAHAFLSLVDDGAAFHVISLLGDRKAETIFKALLDGGIRPYGPPGEIVTGGFGQGVGDAAKRHGMAVGAWDVMRVP